MAQIEKRILELDFDGANFEKGVKSAIDMLDRLQTKLEMPTSTTGFDKIEKRANDVSFKGMENSISRVSANFDSFSIHASDDISNVENTANKFSITSITKAINEVSDRFGFLSTSAQNDLSDVGKAAQNVELDVISTQLQDLTDRFSTLGIVGMSVLNELTRSALEFGKSLVSKVLDPIVAGGKNRAFAIENAHFSLQGLISDETEVQAIMKDALDSVDGTAYAYNDAASAAAQFAATGIRSGAEMQQTLRGIAGVAATTNAEYSDIAHIFTTIAGNGRVMTHELRQFSYRGLNAAATITKAFNEVLHGSSNLSAEMQDHIRSLVQDGMASINNFTGSLEGITEGDLRELVSKGKLDFETFSQIMATTFGEHAKDANKTFNGSMMNIRSALARTGAMFYTDLIVQEGPIVKMFNSIREAVNAFNKVLTPLAEHWTTSVSGLVGGVTEIVTAFVSNDGMAGVGTIIENFVSILKTVGDALLDVFSIKNWNIKDTVGAAAKSFQEWAKSIKPTESQLSTLKRAASGVFALFKIGGQVVGAIVSVFGKLLHALAPLGEVLLNVAADFGDWVVSVSNFIEKTGILNTAVTIISTVFHVLGNMVANTADAVRTFFGYIASGVSSLGVFGTLAERVAERFNALKDSGSGMNIVLGKMQDLMAKIQPIFGKIGEVFARIGKNFSDMIDNFINTGDITAITALINNGLFAALVVSFTRFVNSLSKPKEELKSLFDSLASIPGNFNASLKSLSEALTNLGKVNTPNLIKTAIAIGILALSLLALSKLDLKSTAVGLLGLAGAMAEFSLFIKYLPKLLDSLSGKKGMTKLIAELILIAIAVDIMASALKKIGQLDYEAVVRGMVGLWAAMSIMVQGAKSLDKLNYTLKGVAGQLILFAIAITILAIPIKALGKLPINNLVQGLIGLAAATSVLAIMAKALDGVKIKASTGVALLLVATALTVLSKAVEIISRLPLAGIAAGLVSIAVMLAEVGAFAYLVKPTKLMVAGTAMIALSIALEIMAHVLSKIAAISWEGLIKGLLSLGLILGGVGAFANVVSPTKLMVISIAMIALGAALEIIANVLAKTASLSWEGLAKGLIAIGGAFLIFAVACEAMQGALLGALAITVISAALVPLAFALTMLASVPIPGLIAGLIAIALAFGIFGAAAIILTPLIPMILLLSVALVALGVACLAMGAGIGAAAAGIAMLVGALAAGGAAIIGLIVMLIDQLPHLFQQIGNSIVAFLKSLADSAEQLKTSLVTIGTALIQTFTELTPALVAALVQFVTSLITTFTENAPAVAASVLQCINAILWAVADNIQSIVEAGISIAVNFINGVSESLGSVIDAAFKLVISFINGLADAVRNNHNAMFDAVGNLISAFIEAVIDGVGRIAGSAKDMLDGFFQGIADFDIPGKIKETAENLINGFVGGIKGMIDAVGNAAKEVGDTAVNSIKSLLGINSPSTVFRDIGSNTGEGFIQGFDGKRGEAENSSAAFANGVLGKFQGKEGEAESAGSAISGGVVKGLQANDTNYGTTATAQIGDFLAQIDQAAGSALSSGKAVTEEAINGLMSNAGQYGEIAMSQISEFVNFIANGFGPANAAGMNVTGGVVQGLQVNAGDYAVTGDQQASMFVQNVDGQTGAATNAGVNVTSGAVGGLQSNAGEYDATGNDDGNRFVGGLSAGNWHDAQGTGRSLAEQGKEGAGSVSYDGVGQDAGQGFANGLGSGSAFAAVGRAASALAQHAAGFLESVLHIGSPSKLFKQYGIWCGEGLANGFYASIPVAVEASGELGTMAIDSFTEALSPLNNLTWDIFEDEIEPTITPVVDMSNVVSAGKQFNDIFDQAAIFANIDGLAQSAAASFDIGKTKAHSDTSKTETKEGTNITATWIVNGGQDPERFARQAMRSMKQLARSEGRERK